MRVILLAMAWLVCETCAAGTVTAYTDVGAVVSGHAVIPQRDGGFFAEVRVDGELWRLEQGENRARRVAEVDGNVPVSIRPVVDELHEWSGGVSNGDPQISGGPFGFGEGRELSDGLWLEVGAGASDEGEPTTAAAYPPQWGVTLFFTANQHLAMFEEPLEVVRTTGFLDFPPQPLEVTSVERLSEELGPEMWRIGFRGPYWEVHQTVLDAVVAG